MLVYVWQNARASSVLNRKNRSKLDRHSSINSLPGWFPEKRCRLFSPIAWETEGWLWGNLGRKIRYYLAKAHTIKGVGHEMKDETISRLFVHEVFETSSEWKIVNFPPSVQHSGISVPFVRLYTFQYIMCFRIIGIKRRHEKSRCVCSRDATITKAFQMSLGRVIDWSFLCRVDANRSTRSLPSSQFFISLTFAPSLFIYIECHSADSLFRKGGKQSSKRCESTRSVPAVSI